MEFIDHRAKLSTFSPGFDYFDDASKFDYVYENDDDKLIDDLTDYILDDPDRIEQILESDFFSQLKAQLLDAWLMDANLHQYKNVKKYAKRINDTELLARIESDLEGSTETDDNSEDDGSCEDNKSDDKGKSLEDGVEKNLSSTSPIKSFFGAIPVTSPLTLFDKKKSKTLPTEFSGKELKSVLGLDYLLRLHAINSQKIDLLRLQVNEDPLITKYEQENQSLELLIDEYLVDSTSTEQNKNDQVQVSIFGKPHQFTIVPTFGNGWCAFNAVQLDNPVGCIEALKLKADEDDEMCKELAYAILHNYLSSLPVTAVHATQQAQYVEPFAIDPVFMLQLKDLHTRCESEDPTIVDSRLVNYLSQPALIKSYLDHLIKAKYASIAVVKIYLKYVCDAQQEIGVIIKYGSKYYTDIKDNPTKEIKYVLFDPSQRTAMAHYSRLKSMNHDYSYQRRFI